MPQFEERLIKIEAKTASHEDQLIDLRVRQRNFETDLGRCMNMTTGIADLKETVQRIEGKMDKNISSLHTKVDAVESKVQTIEIQLVKIATKFSFAVGALVILIEIADRVAGHFIGK